ncbi:MAG: Sua5/YciO/YrdC/YwlC family protein [Candidatus Eutrophobiaceae bacterium]
MTIATIDIPAKKTAPGQMTNGLPAMQFKRSLRCLLDGGVLACPTETVYGLSCMAWEKDAVERICTQAAQRA